MWRRWHGAEIKNSFFDALARFGLARWLVCPSWGRISAGLLGCVLHFSLLSDFDHGFCRWICCGHGLGVDVEIGDWHLRDLRVVERFLRALSDLFLPWRNLQMQTWRHFWLSRWKCFGPVEKFVHGGDAQLEC